MIDDQSAIAKTIAQLKQELPAFAECSIEQLETSATWTSVTIRTKDQSHKILLQQSNLDERCSIDLEDYRGNRLNSNAVCPTLADAIAQLRQAAEKQREVLG